MVVDVGCVLRMYQHFKAMSLCCCAIDIARCRTVAPNQLRLGKERSPAPDTHPDTTGESVVATINYNYFI